MRRVILTLLLLLCLCVPAYAANWVEIYKDDNGVKYVDTDSIAQHTSPENHEYVTVWNKSVTSIGELYFFFNAYNKEIKQMQMLSLYVYDEDGKLKATGAWTFEVSKYQEIIPSTFSEKIYDFVMDYYNKNKCN